MFKKQLIKLLNNVVKYARKKNECRRGSHTFIRRLSWSNINTEKNISQKLFHLQYKFNRHTNGGTSSSDNRGFDSNRKCFISSVHCSPTAYIPSLHCLSACKWFLVRTSSAESSNNSFTQVWNKLSSIRKRHSYS